jgi:hypothetical protein
MSERHWEEEQRSVLGRFFDSIFGRNEMPVPEDKIDKEMRWLRTLNKRLDDDND